jgi:hypothetical protein
MSPKSVPFFMICLLLSTSGISYTQPANRSPVEARRPIKPLGAWAERNGFGIRVDRYETPPRCRTVDKGPSPGAKLVYIWLSVRNTSDQIMKGLSIMVELSGVEYHEGGFGGKVCPYDDQGLGSRCGVNSQIQTGTLCQGWVLFEVPASMQLDQQVVTASVRDLPNGIFPSGRWSLRGVTK